MNYPPTAPRSARGQLAPVATWVYETVGSSNTYYPNGACQVWWSVHHHEGCERPCGQDCSIMNVVRAPAIRVNQAFVNMASRVDFCSIFDGLANMASPRTARCRRRLLANRPGQSASPPDGRPFFAAINLGQQCKPQPSSP